MLTELGVQLPTIAVGVVPAKHTVDSITTLLLAFADTLGLFDKSGGKLRAA